MNKMIKKPISIYFILFCSLCLGQPQHTKKEETPIKEPVVQKKTPTYLTVYNDVALVEKIEMITFDQEKQTFSFHTLPLETIDQSVFLGTKNSTVEFLEFYTEILNESKKLSFSATGKTGEKPEINIAYATKNITWEPFYTAEFSKNCDFLTLEGWIDITNQTHTDFESAELTIFDCESCLSEEPTKDTKKELPTETETQTQYAFGLPVDIKKKSSKRLSWIKYTDMPAVKEYRLNVGGVFLEDQTNKNEVPPLELWISSTNKNKQLPKGPLILYKKDDNGKKQILSKMTIPFIKANDALSFKMPHLMDERCVSKQSMKIAYEQTEFQRFTGKIIETANRVTIQNISENPLSVKVFVDFPTPDGIILRENIPHQTDTDKRSFWLLDVPVGDKIDLRYRLRFTQKTQ
jgi:hypothetical protein